MLINLSLEELHDPRMVSLDRCNVNCNTLHEWSSRIYVPNKTKDRNLNVFNMIARIGE